MPLRAVIIGCGNMAQVHIPYILKNKDVQLVALCDKNEIRAKELTQKYNIPYFTDTFKMLDDTKPDVVHILTPPQTHAEIAIQCLDFGYHVFVEKPLCLTMDEVDAIYKSAQSNDRIVGIDYNNLWSPLVQKALQVVESGQIGRVIQIQYVMGDNYLEVLKEGYGKWALDFRGGIFADLIPHPLYLMRAFIPGLKVHSAKAIGSNIKNLRELWVDFTGKDVHANLWMSLNQMPLQHEMIIYCSDGRICIDLRNFNLSIIKEKGLPGPISRIVNTLSESRQRSMGTLKNAFKLVLGIFDPQVGTARAIQAFYQAVKKGDPSPVSEKDARTTVQLSEEIWNLLEITSGSISSEVDENGKVVVHKKLEDFEQNTKGNSPNILVTGGTGFIGNHLVNRLVSEGENVRVLCRRTSNLDQLPTNGVEITFGDVSDLESVKKAIQGIEVLYHLAATTGGDWADHYQGTFVGTNNVLQVALEAEVVKVVYVSSIGVLHSSHFPRNGRVDENFPLEKNPKDRGDYSRAKLEAENIAREFIGKGLDLCFIRPGLVYGSGNSEFLSDAGFKVSNKLVLVVGMGGRRLGLTYVENLVDALVLAAHKKNSKGRTYNIVDTDLPTVRKYIKLYREITRRKLRVLYLPVFLWRLGFTILDCLLRLMRGTSPKLRYKLLSIARGPKYDTSAAQNDLLWKAQISFEDGIKKMFEIKDSD